MKNATIEERVSNQKHANYVHLTFHGDHTISRHK